MRSEVVLMNPITLRAQYLDDFKRRFGEVMATLIHQPGFQGGALQVATDLERAELIVVHYKRWADASSFRNGIDAVRPGDLLDALNAHARGHGSLFRTESAFTFEPSLDIVIRYFAAAHSDDSALSALLSNDVVIDIPASLPYGGRYCGIDEFKSAVRGFAAAWSHVQTHDLQLVGRDDRSATTSAASKSYRSSMRPWSLPTDYVNDIRFFSPFDSFEDRTEV